MNPRASRGGEGRRARAVVAWAVAVLSMPGWASGEEPVWHRQVWVPSRELDKVLSRMSRAVMLSPAEYEALVRQAGPAPEPGPEVRAPYDAVLRRLDLRGSAGETSLDLVAGYEWESLGGDGPISVSLPGPHPDVAAVTGGDAGVIVLAGKDGEAPQVRWQGTGRRTLEARFLVPVRRTEDGFEAVLEPLPVAGGTLELAFAPGLDVAANAPFQTLEDGTTRRFGLPVTGEGLAIRWRRTETGAPLPAAVRQECRVRYFVEETRVRADVGIRIRPGLGRLPEEIVFPLPEGWQVIDAAGPGAGHWNVSGGRLAVRRPVAVGASGSVVDMRLLLETEAWGDGAEPARLGLPIPVTASAGRVEGQVWVYADPAVQVDEAVFPPEFFALAGSALGPACVAAREFADLGEGRPEIGMRRRSGRVHARVDTRAEIHPEGIHVRHEVTLDVREGEWFEAVVRLGDGERIERVEPGREGEPILPWKPGAEGAPVTVSWPRGLTPDRPGSFVVLTRMASAEGAEPAVVPVRGAEVTADQVEGSLVVDASPEWKVTARKTTGLSPVDPRRTGAGEGSLAWRRSGPCQVEVELVRLLPDFDVHLTSRIVPDAGRWEAEGQLDLSIRHSALRELRIGMGPEFAGAVRFSSPFVAEQTAVPGEGTVVLRFHEGLTGFRQLRWRASLPVASERDGNEIRFQAALPRIEVPEATRLTGQWFVGAPGETTLEFSEGNAKRFEAPAVGPWEGLGLSAPRVVAAFDYRGADHGIQVRGFRHVARPVEGLVARRLRISSSVGADGQELHHTELDLENRSASGLGMALPHDAEILELTVDGNAERPVLTGPVIPGATLRFQVRLPQGERVVVRLVHGRRGLPWGRSGEASFRPLELDSRLPVMDTEWRVHVPEGYRVETTATDLRNRTAGPEEALFPVLWRKTEPVRDRWTAGWKDGEEPPTSDAPEIGSLAEPASATPRQGRMLVFHGFQGPSTIAVSYLSRAEAMRSSWVWILVGMVSFWMLAGSRPLVVGVFGVVLLTFLPVSGLTNLGTVSNALLAGWALAVLGSQAWRALGALATAGGPRALPGNLAPGAFALALVLGWGGTGPVPSLSAQEEAPAPPSDLVVVPYDERLPLESQKPRSVYIDTQTFERWWQRAAAARGEALPVEEPGGHVLVEGLHDVVRLERGLAVKARYRLHVSGPDWVRVPFSFAGTVPRATRIDGEPASLGAEGLIARTAGWHDVEVDYEVPFGPDGGKSVRWEVPAASAASLRIRGHVPGERWTVNDGSPVSVSLENGAEVVTASLGSRREIRLSLTAPARVPAMERPPLARAETIYTLCPGLRCLESQIRWEFPGQSIRTFAIELDRGFVPVDLRAPGIETWRLVRPKDGPSRLELDLVRPAVDVLTVEVAAEASGALPSEPSPLPRLVPDAARAEARWSVRVRGPVAVRFQGGTEVREPSEAASRDEGGRWVGAFRMDGADAGPMLTATPVLSRTQVRVGVVHSLGPERQEAVFRIDLRLAEGARQSALELPPGASVRELIPGPGLGDWWREGNVLRVQAGSGSEIKFLLVLEVAAPEDGRDQETPSQRILPELGWPEGSEIEGEVLVAASAGEATEVAWPMGTEVQTAHPDEVLPEVVVLPPFLRQHAFRHRGPAAGGTVAGSRTTPVFDAGVVMSAAVKDTWVQLTFHLDVEVKRSTLSGLTVLAPVELPELRWSGSGLREVRPVDGGKERGYLLLFHEEVPAGITLTATAELPLVRGGVRLPRLSVPDARQLVQFAVLETSVPGGLETNLARVEEIPGDQMPYVPRRLDRPRFFRMIGPDWFFGVGLTKAETLVGAEATIMESEIVTALRESGEEWHHAVYRVRNQSLRFLPVRLPPGMEVVRVRVSSREVQPFAGPSDGSLGETLLVPLEPTRPDDVPDLVELVYRRPPSPEARLQDRFRRSLEAPVLAFPTEGRAEAQTFWKLHLPVGFTGHKIGGPIHPIPASQRAVALVTAHLEELGRLGQVARSMDAEGNPASAWSRIRALAGLTRERLLPEVAAGPGASSRLAEWERDLAAWEQEAAAFRSPVAPVAPAARIDSADAGDGRFEARHPATQERLAKSQAAAVALAESVRGMVRINDCLAWRPDGLKTSPAPSGEPAPDVEDGGAEIRDVVRDWDERRTLALGRSYRLPKFDAVSVPGGGENSEAASRRVADSQTNPEPAQEEPTVDAETLRRRLLPDIDFPVEGDPMVFHKVKGNASLEIQGNRVRGAAVPMAWAWFLAAVAVIRAAAWLTDPGRRVSPASSAAVRGRR